MKSQAEIGPITATTPLRFHDVLPKSVDIVVIGGGIIGICAALYMARTGTCVAVLEKGRVAAEQSSRNWGWVRQQGRDPAELPIMMESIRLWKTLNDETKGATGFRQTGVCYLASSDHEMARFDEWLKLARHHQIETAHLTAEQATAHVGGGKTMLGKQWAGGVFTPSDARAEPWCAVPALARLAQSEGALIRENCAVKSLITTGGTVKGVETEEGILAAEQVVLAGGAWSSLFARQHGLKLPVLSVRSTVVATEPLPELFSGNCADEELAVRRRQDGGYTLALKDDGDHFLGPDSFRHFFAFASQWKELLNATTLHLRSPVEHPDSWPVGKQRDAGQTPFERVRVLDPPPNPKAVQRIRKAFAERFPEFGEPRLNATWSGMIDTTPDILPILDHAPQLSGLIVATGMSGHGFGIGPAFGKIIAEMAAGQQPTHDLSKFGIARFS